MDNKRKKLNQSNSDNYTGKQTGNKFNNSDNNNFNAVDNRKFAKVDKKKHSEYNSDPKYADCYYFLYKECKNSPCKFRHSTSAKKSMITCKYFERTESCPNNDTCPMRHSTYHKDRKRSDEYCFWEQKEVGCTRFGTCEYKHKDPKLDEWKENKIRSLSELKKTENKIEESKFSNQFFNNTKMEVNTQKKDENKSEKNIEVNENKNVDEKKDINVEDEIDEIERLLKEEGIDLDDI